MNDVAESPVDLARQETVGRILDSAERLFRHYGYAKTNVADIARDLGMSPANIYRFFASKVEIHQAICGRMLAAVYQMACQILHSEGSATERLRRFIHAQHHLTVETMLDQEKVHEMVIVALERDWHVIEKHIDRLHDLMAEVIAEGIATGEFAQQDPRIAARCFGAATSTLCHPQMVSQCVNKPNRATFEELTEYALKALKQ
ncbi:TetR family transcriptional regulator [Aminobacter aganoensis]|uniref:AcrR family transcriptional regulator n=1 Tax=Aminobacter aganoensis TaxID=83264 RepID=A0A7X0F8A1_9HYPH|nr:MULTISPECIES: TetR family transcriptional regulator [Aminobacter]KQU76601.1 TetR family transcriptional regulator [Aminobacter sp. DSM 101952]MBB6354963.1 AcrR family transcriptional regulator [Aminobacter aganoensis]